jgi:hypothetical protein
MFLGGRPTEPADHARGREHNALTHNTKALGVGRVLDRFGDIVTRLRQIADRFDVVCDCVDTTFVPATSNPIDLDYQRLRADMRALFDDLGITTAPAAA